MTGGFLKRFGVFFRLRLPILSYGQLVIGEFGLVSGRQFFYSRENRVPFRATRPEQGNRGDSLCVYARFDFRNLE
jgi:hypothetical protein